MAHHEEGGKAVKWHSGQEGGKVVITVIGRSAHLNALC